MLTSEQFESKWSERQSRSQESHVDHSLTFFAIFCITGTIVVIVGFILTLYCRKSYNALRSDEGNNETTTQGQCHLKTTEITDYVSEKKQFRVR